MHSPTKAARLQEYFGQLDDRMVFRNPQPSFSSVTAAVPKDSSFGMAADEHAGNRIIAHSAIRVPRLKELGILLG